MKEMMIIGILLLAGCAVNEMNEEPSMKDVDMEADTDSGDDGMIAKDDLSSRSKPEIATFAGGCFWCVEANFEKHPGIISAVSGYAGGEEESPTYKEVSAGTTGHRESVQITYDPDVISYEELLDIFWRTIDPTDEGGSFVDRGFQYTSAIFYHDDEQKRLAEESADKVRDRFGSVATEIIPYTTFYPAEEYHQDYYKKNPLKYKYYRSGSGRDDFIEENWEKPDKEELKQRLTPLQYKVTQEEGTEPAFDNEYWDNYEEGIYVDLIDGKPLFSSTDKYKSGTGWPSFTKPIEDSAVTEHEDRKLLSVRTEIRSASSDAHLGHVFDDGPEPTGLRYCMNSAALRFIPKDQMEEEGYGDYLYLFS